MPYLINTNDIVLVTLRYRVGNQTCLNNVHYRYEGSAPIADGATALQDLISDLKTDAVDGWVVPIVSATSDQVVFNQITGQKIYPTRYAPQVTLMGNTGGQAVAAYPPNVSACISKKIELAKKGRVGRIEIAGLPQDTAVNGLWTSGTMTNLEVVANNLKLDRVAGAEGPFKPIVFNKKLPATSEIISATLVQQTARVMRRRTVGLGI